MKKLIVCSLILALLLTLTACGSEEETETEETAEVTIVSESDMFTSRDLDGSYDESSATKITLSGDSASADSDTVQTDGSTVTITAEGTYILSGTLTDGMIKVEVADTEKVQLVLDGVAISNSTSAAIYVVEADKVFITTAADSENTLENSGEYVAIDDNNIDSVIFSKADLTLNGAGTLTVNAAAGHGIVSKDDLVLTSGTYSITSASHGLSGKDSVRIADGTYSITAGKDGIHAENTDDTSLGFVYIANGSFSVTATGDGISAGNYLQIKDGTYDVVTGEGSAAADMKTEFTTTTEEDTESMKGLKAGAHLTISDGTFVTDTEDDSIHANGTVNITTGNFALKSGDDAIHSDDAVTIENGTFNISYCYEGIEGLSVTIEDGTFNITAEDDGINAGGGADSSGFEGAFPGQEQFMNSGSGADSASEDIFVTIHGGTFVMVCSGDCIDSNNYLTIDGGTLDLTCNGDIDTALDCEGTYNFDGSDITTNDGSENNASMMGGGTMGNPGQMGGVAP